MRLDSASVHAVAERISAAADLIDDAVANHLTRLSFDGACAGRAHVARGAALRAGLDRLAAELAQWSRAALETAVALRSAAERYGDADRYAATRMG